MAIASDEVDAGASQINTPPVTPRRRLLIASIVALATAAACESGEPGGAPEPGAPIPDGGTRDARPNSGPPPEECEPKTVASAPIPEAYVGRTSPLVTTPAVLEAGKARFLDRCAICHGAGGKGDGKGGPYVPPSADLTARLRAEDYLFWRIAEGGYLEPFCSAMPGFAKSYSERQRWELVAHLRDLAGASAAGDAAAD